MLGHPDSCREAPAVLSCGVGRRWYAVINIEKEKEEEDDVSLT